MSARRPPPQLVPVALECGVGYGCRPARVIVCAVTATKHEPGLSLFFVLYRASQQWRFGLLDEIALSLPTCTQRSFCRGAALASRFDPLAFSDERGRSKALFSLCSAEHQLQIQNLSIFHATRDNRKRHHPPLASASPLTLQLYHCSTGFPHTWRTTFAIPRTPMRLVTTHRSSL